MTAAWSRGSSTAIGAGCPGETFRPVRSLADAVEAAPPLRRRRDLGRGLVGSAVGQPTPRGWWTGRPAWTPRSSAPISTPPPLPAAQGAGSNYTNLLVEPADHALGRSRGGLSTKVHQLVDGNGHPLVVLVGPGRAGDAPMFPNLMTYLRIDRCGPGRARTRQPSGFARTRPTRRGRSAATCAAANVAVIPEPADQQGHRKRRGSRGGRPPRSRPRRLPQPQRRRTRLLPRQTVARARHPGVRTSSPITFRGGVVLEAVVTWLRGIGATTLGAEAAELG